jgi:hypothetical protein
VGNEYSTAARKNLGLCEVLEKGTDMSQQILNHQPLPVKLQQVLQKAELPTPLEVFCVSLTKTFIMCSIWIAILCCNFILVLLCTVATWSCEPANDSEGGIGCDIVAWSLHVWPDNVLLDILQICWCIAFLLALAFFLRYLIYHYRHRYLCVYPWGLFSTPNLAFSWERIQKVWRGRKLGGEPPPRVQVDAIRLLRDDGKTFRFDKVHWNRNNTQQRNALCDLIERELVRVHLPLLLEQFDRGDRLSFDPLHVSRTGLGNKEREISWEEVEHFEVGELVVRIQERGQASNWSYVPDLPNVCLLREIAHQRELMRRG